MDEETKLKMMENLLKNARVGQLNMVVESGATVNYYEAGAKENDNRATDEQIWRAISAINGRDKILRHQQAFLGICCYLASTQKWPNNLEACAERVAMLDKGGEWYCACKWESLRKFSRYSFAMADYAMWDELKPNSTENALFQECRDVARAFDEQLKLEMQK